MEFLAAAGKIVRLQIKKVEWQAHSAQTVSDSTHSPHGGGKRVD
jgi:hypothetical protein